MCSTLTGSTVVMYLFWRGKASTTTLNVFTWSLKYDRYQSFILWKLRLISSTLPSTGHPTGPGALCRRPASRARHMNIVDDVITTSAIAVEIQDVSRWLMTPIVADENGHDSPPASMAASCSTKHWNAKPWSITTLDKHKSIDFDSWLNSEFRPPRSADELVSSFGV